MSTAHPSGVEWVFIDFLIGIFAIIAVVVYCVTKIWKERRSSFLTNPLCFRLVTDKRRIRNAVALTTVLCSPMPTIIVAVCNAGIDNPSDFYMLNMWLVIAWLMFIMIFVGLCIEYLTNHLCISDLNVRVQSAFNNSPEKILNWKQIIAVELHHHPSDPSRLSRVIIKGDLSSHTIVIAGYHPQIGTIIQLIKDKVPDKFVDIADTQPKINTYLFRNIKAAVNIIVFAWSIYLLSMVLNNFSLMSASSITSATRLFTATIWVFGIWTCTPNLFVFAVNYRRRQQEFAECTACYPLLSQH